LSLDTQDHYQVLGIGRDASPAEVKSAYRRLAKVHTPEDAPDRFREISRAFEVLSDPDARKRYDAEERLPVPVVLALQEAESLAEKDPAAAVAAAKSVLSAHGRSALVRFCVAQACLRAKHAKDAIDIAENLTREDPARPEYAHFLGDAYLADERIDDADRALKVALSLDANRLGVYLSLADAHNARSRPDDALLVLDRGLRLDDGATLRTLPLRTRKLMILAQNGRWDDMTRVVTAIQSAVPASDPDAAQHTAWQLCELAQRYDAASVYDVAKFLFDASVRIRPHPALAARSKELDEAAATARACRAAAADESVADWLRALMPQHFGGFLGEAAWKRQWQAIASRVAAQPKRADREWASFKRAHPAAAAAIAKQWRLLRGSSRTRPTAAKASFGGGVIVVFIAMAIGMVSRMNSRSDPPAPKYSSDEMFRDFERTRIESEKLIKSGQQRLGDTLLKALEDEEKRRGRPMTRDEQVEFLMDRTRVTPRPDRR